MVSDHLRPPISRSGPLLSGGKGSQGQEKSVEPGSGFAQAECPLTARAAGARQSPDVSASAGRLQLALLTGSPPRRHGSRIAGRPPRPCRFRQRPGKQVRLAVQGLPTKTLEGGSAPDAGELRQCRGCGAVAACGEEVGRLPSVEPTFKFSSHIGPNPSLGEIRGKRGHFPGEVPQPDEIRWRLMRR